MEFCTQTELVRKQLSMEDTFCHIRKGAIELLSGVHTLWLCLDDVSELICTECFILEVWTECECLSFLSDFEKIWVMMT